MQNYRMHSLHCARNIALCPDCDEPIPRGELEEHKEEVHGLRDCPLCAEKVEACKLEDHQVTDQYHEMVSHFSFVGKHVF